MLFPYHYIINIITNRECIEIKIQMNESKKGNSLTYPFGFPESGKVGTLTETAEEKASLREYSSVLKLKFFTNKTLDSPLVPEDMKSNNSIKLKNQYADW